jgi:hypothetical protein
MAAGHREEAARWWTAALRTIPKSIELTPSEQGRVAALKLRLGDKAGAQQLISSLSEIGYRHPTYLAAIAQARSQPSTS